MNYRLEELIEKDDKGLHRKVILQVQDMNGQWISIEKGFDGQNAESLASQYSAMLRNFVEEIDRKNLRIVPLAGR